MRVEFSSQEKHYMDEGPIVKHNSRLKLCRDVLRDSFGRELARFVMNAWITTTGEAYEDVDIVSATAGAEMFSSYEKSPCYQAALHYLSLGWCPVALCPPDHFGVGAEHMRLCKKPGKVPVNLYWRQWQTRRPTKEELTEQWKRNPNANVGVVTGAVSELVGVDVDGDLHTALAAIPGGLKLPDTLTFRTGRGVRFLYEAKQQLPASCQYKAKETSIEVLAEGRLTVMPPSRHKSGAIYTWEHRDPGKLAQFKTQLPSKQQGTQFDANPQGVVIAEGERNNTLFKAGAALRRFGAGEDEIFSALTLMNSRCVPPLQKADIVTIARQAAKYKSILKAK